MAVGNTFQDRPKFVLSGKEVSWNKHGLRLGSVRPEVCGSQPIKKPSQTQTQAGRSCLPARNCLGCFSHDTPTGNLID